MTFKNRVPWLCEASRWRWALHVTRGRLWLHVSAKGSAKPGPLTSPWQQAPRLRVAVLPAISRVAPGSTHFLPVSQSAWIYSNARWKPELCQTLRWGLATGQTAELTACRPAGELCRFGPISLGRENAHLQWCLGECGREGLVSGACRRPGSSFVGWRSLRWDFVALSPAGCSTPRKQIHQEKLSVVDRERLRPPLGCRTLRLAVGLCGRLVLCPPLLIPIPECETERRRRPRPSPV